VKNDKLKMQFHLNEVNPVFYLCGVLLLAIVVLFFNNTQTAVTVAIELALIGTGIAAFIIISRRDQRIADLALLADAAAIAESLRYLLAASKKLKTASTGASATSAREALLSLYGGLVQTPLSWRGFVLRTLQNITGRESIDPSDLAAWDTVNTLKFPSDADFEEVCIRMRDCVANFVRASAGMGHDVKTLEQRRNELLKALADLSAKASLRSPAASVPVIPEPES
jgi:hypothetical protein